MHFGLGKALGDVGDSVGAFHHFDIGNRLKRQTISYDADGVSQWMREIAVRFSAESLKGKGGNWTYEDINKFISKPSAYMPGTKMSYPGESDAGKRADILAYLRTVSDAPVDFPK